MALLVEALDNEPSGRLYKALIESKLASNQFGFSFALKDPGYAYFSAEVLKEKSLADARKAMMGVFDGLKDNPFTQEELDRARNKLLKNWELAFNSSDRVGRSMSEYIAQGDWRLWFVHRDNLAKATLADLNRVAVEYFKPSNRTVGIFIPEEKPDRAVIPAPPDVASMVKEYKGKAKLADAEEFDPSPDNINSRTKELALSGGAKYALLKKTTRGGTVDLSLTLRIGNEAVMQNKSTVSEFTASMLRRGSAKHSFQEINDKLDQLKANVSIRGGGQSVSVGVHTVKENLIAVLGLVTEMLRQPAFEQAEFEKLVEEELANIDQQRSEPQAVASNLFQRIMNPWPSTDFRYTMTFDEQAQAVKNLKLEDIRKFYNEYYSSVHATMAIVGDFEEPTLTVAINSMLEKWTSPVQYVHAEDKHFEVTPRNEKVNTPDKANALMLCGFNIALRDDDPDYPALLLGNYMLGGGFLNSRLAVRIRQKEGISYGVGSWLQADPIDKTGAFGSYAIYNPDNSEKLVAAYKEEINKVITEGFTAEELKDASSGYLQSRNVSRAQDRSLAGTLANNLFLKRTMTWDEELEKKIGALTVAEVNAAMKKWITPDKITFVQAGEFDKEKAQ